MTIKSTENSSTSLYNNCIYVVEWWVVRIENVCWDLLIKRRHFVGHNSLLTSATIEKNWGQIVRKWKEFALPNFSNIFQIFFCVYSHVTEKQLLRCCTLDESTHAIYFAKRFQFQRVFGCSLVQSPPIKWLLFVWVQQAEISIIKRLIQVRCNVTRQGLNQNLSIIVVVMSPLTTRSRSRQLVGVTAIERKSNRHQYFG